MKSANSRRCSPCRESADARRQLRPDREGDLCKLLHKSPLFSVGGSPTTLKRANYLDFFSCFAFRFSFRVIVGFFWTSFLPLSFLPDSPTFVLRYCNCCRTNETTNAFIKHSTRSFRQESLRYRVDIHFGGKQPAHPNLSITALVKAGSQQVSGRSCFPSENRRDRS
jgi:hypothetical protein